MASGNYQEPLALIVSENCSRGCDICSMDCKPHGGSSLSLGDVMYCLNQAKPLGINKVGWSGGELTDIPEFKEMVKYAGEIGFESYFMTNGGFGKDEMTALKEGLKYRQANVGNVMISTDPSHGVSKKRIANVVKGFSKAGIGVGLASSYFAGEFEKSARNVQSVAEEIGGRLVKIIDDYQIIFTQARARELRTDGIPVNFGAVARVGRARKIRPEKFSDIVMKDSDKCQYRHLSVTPRKQYQPCCAHYTFDNKQAFSLGGIYEIDMETARKKAWDVPFVKASEIKGEALLMKQALMKSEDPKVRAIACYPYASICEMCSNVMSNPESKRIAASVAGDF